MSKDKKNLVVRVSFYDCVVVYNMPPSVSGGQLLLKACNRIGTHEVWWFGLQTYDSKNQEFWLNLEKRLDSQNIKTDNNQLSVKFEVKFYPVDFKIEVIQDTSKRIFYYNLKAQLMNEELYCDAATIVSLAALHLQITEGDLSKTPGASSIIIKNLKNLIPPGVALRHSISNEEWLSIILNMWKSNSVLLPSEALQEALSILQDLDMYSIRYYHIKNKKKTPLLLGIEPGGMNIYKVDNRMVPRVSLTWNEIKSISYIDKRFVIKPMDKNAQDFIMYSDNTKANDTIMHVSVGNHELYLLRRNPQDPADIKALKDKAKEAQRLVEEEVKKDMVAKEKKAEYEENLEKLQDAAPQDVKKIEEDVNKSYDNAVNDLSKRMQELEIEAEKARLEASISKEEVAEMRTKQLLIASMDEQRKTEADKMAQEANEAKQLALLKEAEAERSRIELEELKKKYLEDQKLIEKLKKESEEKIAITPIKVEPEKVQDSNPLKLVKKSDKFQTKAKDLKTLRKERESNVKDQVQNVKDLLVKSAKETTENDKIQEEMLRKGDNKYKTLKSVRNGNTRTRIDEFEAM